MTLEDFWDAMAFKCHGVAPPEKWIDELRMQAELATFNSLM
jgi:hypothetical protein